MAAYGVTKHQETTNAWTPEAVKASPARVFKPNKKLSFSSTQWICKCLSDVVFENRKCIEFDNHSCEPVKTISVSEGSKNNHGVQCVMQSSGCIVNIAEACDFIHGALLHCQKLCDCGFSSVTEVNINSYVQWIERKKSSNSALFGATDQSAVDHSRLLCSPQSKPAHHWVQKNTSNTLLSSGGNCRKDHPRLAALKRVTCQRAVWGRWQCFSAFWLLSKMTLAVTWAGSWRL